MGDWLLVPESAIIAKSGKPFAPQKRNGKRPIVLSASLSGPNAIAYARSSTSPSEFKHPAHSQPHDGEPCNINLDGWVALDVTLTVDINEVFSSHKYSCREPEKSSLWAAIERRLRP